MFSNLFHWPQSNFGRKRSVYHLFPPPKISGSLATMAQEKKEVLVMSEPTDLGICTWLAEACKNRVGPASFVDLQITYKAAFPRAKDLEEWAWPEFTVRADHYNQLIGYGPKYNQ